MYYVGLEGDGDNEIAVIEGSNDDSNVVVRGVYGGRSYEMSIAGNACTTRRTWSYRIASRHVWAVEHVLMDRYRKQWFAMQQTLLHQHHKKKKKGHRKRKRTEPSFDIIPNETDANANVVMVQCVANRLPLRLQVRFGHALSMEEIEEVHNNAITRFHKHFDRTFNLDSRWRELGIYSLSNLLGGLAYFHGDSLHQREG